MGGRPRRPRLHPRLQAAGGGHLPRQHVDRRTHADAEGADHQHLHRIQAEAARAAECAAESGILWSRRTQDISSNVTGSSIFDFAADGVSEVVYGDECFTRVYNGQTGWIYQDFLNGAPR